MKSLPAGITTWDQLRPLLVAGLSDDIIEGAEERMIGGSIAISSENISPPSKTGASDSESESSAQATVTFDTLPDKLLAEFGALEVEGGEMELNLQCPQAGGVTVPVACVVDTHFEGMTRLNAFGLDQKDIAPEIE